MRNLAVVFSLALLAVTGCDRPERDECEAACMRYNEILFWERFAKEVEGKPEEEVARLRAEREETWREIETRESDPGKANCITDCRRHHSRDWVRCMDGAETADDARRCTERTGGCS